MRIPVLMVLSALLLMLVGCGDDPRRVRRDTGTSDTGSDAADDSGPRDASTDAPVVDLDAACATAVETAEVEILPVDIIWVVDNSASMETAITQVQLGLNDFARRIEMSGLDFRVIMLSLRGPSSPDGRFPVCIPAPLSGDSSCGDGPRFFQSSVDIRSTQPLEQFLGTLGQTPGFADGESRGGPAWHALLRPEASKTIVVVSDDDSRLSAAQFETYAGGTNPFNSTTLPPGILDTSWDGLFANYTFSGLYGWGSETDPTETCMFSDGSVPDNPGETYTALVSRTGGVRAQICDGASAWGPFFDAVASTVEETARISCEIPLPPPPDGMMIDADKVNVILSGSMASSVLPKVADAAACGPAGGWYYDDDDAPTQVILCPDSCDDANELVRDEGAAGVEVQFGCDTLFI